jgi:asparagine synthase (glutamine-hydrolysing)
MCGIAGIMALNDQDVSIDLIKMLKAIEHRGPDGSGVYVDGKIIYDDLKNLTAPEGSFGLGHNLLSIVGTEVSQPIKKHDFILVANAEIYNFREIKTCLKDEYNTDSDCEVIISVINQYYKGSLLDAVVNSLEKLDGDYAFAVYDGKDCIVVRDPIGVKPVYYGENLLKGIFAFASERKALWKIGLKNLEILPPDHILLNGVPVKLEKRNNSISDTQEVNLSCLESSLISSKYKNRIKKDKSYYKNELKELMISSVEKRIKEISDVGIIFSGGVDSTIIAKLSQELGANTTLYTVGNETSIDMEYAIRTAKILDLPLKIKTLDVDDVRMYTELVLNAIEEFNIMKLGVGMPSYIASEMANIDDIKVVMSGQGADEIFAGYHRYIAFYEDEGEDAKKHLKEDVSNLYHVNLQRDDAVTMANSVELRVPYLDKDLVEMVMEMPMKYKMGNGKENLRKCILRELAADLNLPKEIVLRPKKAAQYGSGIHKLLVKKVLKDENYKNKLEARYKNIE